MTALFVALGIMVLALLALLLWFVPHLLQQQARRVAGETSQLREMLLDLLSEQEAVTMRQTQLGATLSHVQDQLAGIAEVGIGPASRQAQLAAETGIQQLETRLSDLQAQIQVWAQHRQSESAHAAGRSEEATFQYRLAEHRRRRRAERASERDLVSPSHTLDRQQARSVQASEQHDQRDRPGE